MMIDDDGWMKRERVREREEGARERKGDEWMKREKYRDRVRER